MSGPRALSIGNSITGRALLQRQAIFANFSSYSAQAKTKHVIDSGLAIYFAGPKSFTGEDVVELQGHGGPVIQDLLLKEVLKLGARQARPGEFSERAFLNDKIDLTQAEAIADLIDSSTAQAARGAMRSLQGEFSRKVQSLLQELIALRMYVEAAIDFPEEEIDFLADERVADSIQQLQDHLQQTIRQAGQGTILRNGLRLVLAGKPNAGKSSLLNALSGADVAIVTDIPGTTRDAVSQSIDMDGLPVHVIDTAGLRDSTDTVEMIGIARARQAMADADHVLFLVDACDKLDSDFSLQDEKFTLVFNKIDLVDKPPKVAGICISATRGDGLPDLIQHIKTVAGFEGTPETLFTARRRHLTALSSARDAVERGLSQLRVHNAGELLADELLQAQQSLNEITGEFSADDLLGEIFAGFCIGK